MFSFSTPRHLCALPLVLVSALMTATCFAPSPAQAQIPTSFSYSYSGGTSTYTGSTPQPYGPNRTAVDGVTGYGAYEYGPLLSGKSETCTGRSRRR